MHLSASGKALWWPSLLHLQVMLRLQDARSLTYLRWVNCLNGLARLLIAFL